MSQATRKALLARNMGSDVFVCPSDMEAPLRCMLDKTLEIKMLDPKLQPRLTTLGSSVDADILDRACEAMHRKRRRASTRRVYGGIGATLVGVLLVTAMAALLWLVRVVELRKEAQNIHGILADRTTGRALETANTDFTVLADSLVLRGSSLSRTDVLATAST